MSSPEFKHSVENFRGIAIACVVLSHLPSLSSLGVFEKYAHFILANATTYFVFISGYFFSYIEKVNDFDYRHYVWKKFRFVIAPYLILSIAAVLAGLYYQQHELIGLHPIEYILWSLAVGGNVNGPMWFVPMIGIFFILSPVFNAIKNPVLIAVTVFTVILSLFSSRPYANMNPFLAFIHFLGFYLLGMSAHALQLSLDNTSRARSLIISGVAAAVFVIMLAFYQKDVASQAGEFRSFIKSIGEFNTLQFGKLMALIFTHMLFDKLYNKKNAFLSYLARISFGLFFIHGIYIHIFSKYISPELPSTIMKTTFEAIFIIVASMVTISVVKKILGDKSRYVIGC